MSVRILWLNDGTNYIIEIKKNMKQQDIKLNLIINFHTPKEITLRSR